MFRKNRDSLEIMSDIINCTMHGVSKISHIMRMCNLSYEQVDNYINEMIKNGLVNKVYAVDEGITIYIHTQKGIEFRRNVLNALEMIN